MQRWHPDGRRWCYLYGYIIYINVRQKLLQNHKFLIYFHVASTIYYPKNCLGPSIQYILYRWWLRREALMGGVIRVQVAAWAHLFSLVWCCSKEKADVGRAEVISTPGSGNFVVWDSGPGQLGASGIAGRHTPSWCSNKADDQTEHTRDEGQAVYYYYRFFKNTLISVERKIIKWRRVIACQWAK